MFRRKHWIIIFLVTLVLLLIFAMPVGGWKARQVLSSGEQQFAGSVETVNPHTCEICQCVELSITLKSSSERLEVRLGPKSFFEQRDFYLSPGDRIELTGIRFTERGKEIVLATEVRKGSEKIILRGKNGKPAWMEAHGHICPVCGN